MRSSRYLDPKYLELEKTKIFGRAWLSAGPVTRIPHPGDVFLFEELGESIAVVRGEDGAIRAFHNSCRHRGSKLLDGRESRLREIRCPYHGWSYGLDGCLSQVPGRDGFERMDRNRLGLKQVRTEEWLGQLWLNLDSNAPPLGDTLCGLGEELAPYRLEEMTPLQSFDKVLRCNWKAMLENVMDFYHVPQVHQRTVGRHVPTPPDLTSLGHHTRQRLEIASYGWRKRLDRACTRGGPYSNQQISSLHKYLVFPNFLINVLPYHLTIMQVFPLGTDRCRLRYSFCYRRGARGVERLRAVGTWLASRLILHEDLEIVERLQEGLATGRVENQLLHDEEAASSHFHAVIDEWLGS